MAIGGCVVVLDLFGGSWSTLSADVGGVVNACGALGAL